MRGHIYYKTNKCSAKMDMDIGHPCCVWRRDNLSSSKVDKYWNNFFGAQKLESMTLESGVSRIILGSRDGCRLVKFNR